ncbi:integrase core domain-containing protein [Serratia proteamaculans]
MVIFNARFPDESLNEHRINAVSHVRKVLSEWRRDHNECRPHSAQNYQKSSQLATSWRKRHSESEGSGITAWAWHLIFEAVLATTVIPIIRKQSRYASEKAALIRFMAGSQPQQSGHDKKETVCSTPFRKVFKTAPLRP